MTKPVWIDCDPGVDDATTLLLAHKMTSVDLVGVSTVAGNATHEHTFDNARRLMEFIDCKASVYPGASVPMLRPLTTAPYIHGEDGLGGIELPEAKHPPEEKKAWDALYEAAKQYGKDLEVLAIGPLTNIGIALAKYPDLPSLLNRIIIMGGSATIGNTTPAAEFNIYVDPEAADRVFKSGIPVVMFGLDVTMKSYLMPEDLDEIAQTNSPQGRFVRDCFGLSWQFCQKLGLSGVPVHDSCTVLYLEYPEIFKLYPAWVRVETKGKLTRGKTVTDLFSDKKLEPKNTQVALKVDRERFATVIKAILKRYR